MDGRTLTRIREDLNLTREQLANILRVYEQLVVYWEKDLTPIPSKIAEIVFRFHRHGLTVFKP